MLHRRLSVLVQFQLDEIEASRGEQYDVHSAVWRVDFHIHNKGVIAFMSSVGASKAESLAYILPSYTGQTLNFSIMLIRNVGVPDENQ